MLFLEQLNQRWQEEIFRPRDQLSVRVRMLFCLTLILWLIAVILLNLCHQVCRCRVFGTFFRRFCASNVVSIVCWWWRWYAERMGEIKHAYWRWRLWRRKKKTRGCERTERKKNDLAIKAGRKTSQQCSLRFREKSRSSINCGGVFKYNVSLRVNVFLIRDNSS